MPTFIECPKSDVLERLLLGQVTPEEAGTLEAHVLGCPRCAQALRDVRAVDGLVVAMQAARTLPPPLVSEAADTLMPWLKRLRPKEPTQTLSSSAAAETPPMAIVLPTYDFLTGPIEADELGRLGDYRVLQPIGVGGMGIVFLAEDPRLKRHVALKLIKPELLARKDLHKRFFSEARAIAAVEHDNIVIVYEADEISGVPYLVMPFLRGESLADHLERQKGPLAVEEILRIGREIAAGLAAAHERGLVHRDIKPSNVWLESKSPEPSVSGSAKAADKNKNTATPAAPNSGRVKILDFGLARTVEGLDDEGKPNAILGTPAYMSPEQGRGLVVDPRADLFSLGCVMYQMATARLPFQGQDIITTLLSVATEVPVSPKKLNPQLPAELVALIEKLLAKKAADRPASARQVVAALQEMERQRQPRAIGRWLLALAASVGLAIAASLGLFSYLHRPPPPVAVTFAYDEPDAVLLLQREDGAEEEIDVQKATQHQLLPGTYLVRPKKPVEHRQLWPDHFVVQPNEPMAVAFRLVGLIRTYDGHLQPITAVAFSPRKDSFLALSGSKDFDVRIWDTRKGDAGIRLIGHESPVRCLALSPDGKRAITGSGKPLPRNPDTRVRVWDLDTRTCVATLTGHDSSVTAVAMDANGKFFLSGDRDGKVIFWDARELKLIQAIHAHDRADVNGLAFLPGGKQALSGGGDHKLLLWDVAKRSVVRTLDGHKEAITAVSAAPDRNQAATSSNDGTIRIWNLDNGESRQLKGHEKEILCLAYAPDGKRLLSGGWDKTVRLWNADTGELIHTFLGHHKAVHAVAFSADGRRALSGGSDLTVCLWELP